jgi:hypothetical protein
MPNFMLNIFYYLNQSVSDGAGSPNRMDSQIYVYFLKNTQRHLFQN